jgi:beta-lactamase class A
MRTGIFGTVLAACAMMLAPTATAQSSTDTFEKSFDTALGTEARKPQTFQARYDSELERQIAQIAEGSHGRIGVAAIDLSTGNYVGVLGDQRFPMASTSKVAIAATFLEGVEQGRWSLASEFPLLLPQRSAPFSSARAPVSEGQRFPAIDLIEMMITRSNNSATDALLRVVGGPAKVNDWVRRHGIKEFSLDRDIATLVRDDGEFNPANHIDLRDSATPKAMVQLLSGLYQGKFLSDESRRVLLGAMSRTVTGKRRIPALMPAEVRVSHKTGSLNNTSSDVGILETPDGRAVAVAIYVTGQGTRLERESRIAQIARALHDGYAAESHRNWAAASYGSR